LIDVVEKKQKIFMSTGHTRLSSIKVEKISPIQIQENCID